MAEWSRRAVLASGAATLVTAACGQTGQKRNPGRFALTRSAGRHWLRHPDGGRFFSIGLNHIDPGPLMTPGGLWETRYGNDLKAWLGKVGDDLRDWGFNSVGWTQESVARGETLYRHAPPLNLEEYAHIGLPYCHMLPFAEFHQWDAQTRHPDFTEQAFADWCDHVARTHCMRMKDDPNLIGYFLIDCPTWIHTRPQNEWRGPLFDPERAQTLEGRKALFDLASRYYRTCHDAIRRYDPDHLILGDRYDAREPISDAVIEAALPFVDVLSFQHFDDVEPVIANLEHWHRQTGKPVLLADHARSRRVEGGYRENDGEKYAAMLDALQDVTGCIGFHYCGAYLRNDIRRRGFLKPDETPAGDALDRVRQANADARRWMIAG